MYKYVLTFSLLILGVIGCKPSDSPTPSPLTTDVYSTQQEYTNYLVSGGLSNKDCLLILVDCSGSMSGTRLDEAKKALTRYLDVVDQDTATYLYTIYQGNVKSFGKLDRNELKSTIASLKANGGTPLGKALEKIHSDAMSFEVAYAHMVALVLTDGECDWYDEFTMRHEAVGISQSRMFLDVVGYDLGKDVRHSLSEYAARYRTADQTSLVNVLLEKE